MSTPTIGVASARTTWARRRRRATHLGQQLPYAAVTMRLYLCLLEAQELAHARALADRPEAALLADYVVRIVAPAVAAAVEGSGIDALAAASRPWLHEQAAPDIGRWLAGAPVAPVGAFFARASTAPVLEALAECGSLLPVTDLATDLDAMHCPHCGGLPQFAFTGVGDQLVTPQQRLGCARCGQDWAFPRLRCVACGETYTGQLGSFAAESRPEHLRVDACQSCRAYWLHIDLRREPEAVPEVDELAALPLDLHAQEQGFAKVVRNLMGIG